MLFDAVIFDRDGTLYDSLDVIFGSFDYAVQPYLEKPPTREEWIRAFGPAEIEVIGKFIGRDKKQAAFNRFFDYYRSHFDGIRMYPGMRELLVRLKEKSMKLMIFTGGGRISTHFCLEQTGVLQLFDAMICGEDVKRPKPHPEGLLKLTKEQDLIKRKTVLVGDAASDVEAGSAAGFKTVWLRWSENARSAEPRVRPDYECDSVERLKKILLQEDPS
jgi:HAD superfamily hydrolase (TIGR01509 family)